MKLKFHALDGRGATLEARLTAGDEAALEAFGDWCEASLPSPGEMWSRMDLPLASSPLRTGAAAPDRRILVVFGDLWLARRFREAWC